MTEENTKEKIPPLPKLEVYEPDRKYIDQEKMDRAMQIIYEQHPDFFKRLFECYKSFEDDPTKDEDAWEHKYSEFIRKIKYFIRHVVLKEIVVTDPMKLTTIQGCVFTHVRRIAHVMHGNESINRTL